MLKSPSRLTVSNMPSEWLAKMAPLVLVKRFSRDFQESPNLILEVSVKARFSEDATLLKTEFFSVSQAMFC